MKAPYLYVASSWRNPHQPAMVEFLKTAGYEVYDFRNPEEGDNGFAWRDIDPDWQSWTPHQYRVFLVDNPLAIHGLELDEKALRACDGLVLLNPCGRSAHLELGFAIGAGKPTAIMLNDGDEPELMYGMASTLCINVEELADWLSVMLPTKRDEG